MSQRSALLHCLKCYINFRTPLDTPFNKEDSGLFTAHPKQLDGTIKMAVYLPLLLLLLLLVPPSLLLLLLLMSMVPTSSHQVSLLLLLLLLLVMVVVVVLVLLLVLSSYLLATYRQRAVTWSVVSCVVRPSWGRPSLVVPPVPGPSVRVLAELQPITHM